MSRSSLTFGLFVLAAAACSDSVSSRVVGPSAAGPSRITSGTVDASNTFANVGAFILQRKSDGQVFPICSGTLIAPTVFLTAGHCTIFYPGVANDFTAGVSFGNPIAWGAQTNPAAKV